MKKSALTLAFVVLITSAVHADGGAEEIKQFQDVKIDYTTMATNKLGQCLLSEVRKQSLTDDRYSNLTVDEFNTRYNDGVWAAGGHSWKIMVYFDSAATTATSKPERFALRLFANPDLGGWQLTSDGQKKFITAKQILARGHLISNPMMGFTGEIVGNAVTLELEPCHQYFTGPSISNE